jgi:hypothetical protein
MSATTLAKELTRLRAQLEAQTGAAPLLKRWGNDPAEILRAAGMAPDPWQAKLMRSRSGRLALLCTRQAGKSTVAAALALKAAFLEAPALVLLLSPTLRQSGELFRDKVRRIYTALGRPVPTTQETALTMALANGSRIVSLPGDEGTVRGYSGVRLLVIDEAARVPDSLYYAVRPMLAVSRGRLVALSSAYAKTGWFYSSWESAERWERVKIPAGECPRISPEFLEEERAALGPRWFAMEYCCEWGEMVDALFSEADIAAAMDDGTPPLFRS